MASPIFSDAARPPARQAAASAQGQASPPPGDPTAAPTAAGGALAPPPAPPPPPPPAGAGGRAGPCAAKPPQQVRAVTTRARARPCARALPPAPGAPARVRAACANRSPAPPRLAPSARQPPPAGVAARASLPASASPPAHLRLPRLPANLLHFLTRIYIPMIPPSSCLQLSLPAPLARQAAAAAVKGINRDLSERACGSLRLFKPPWQPPPL